MVKTYEEWIEAVEQEASKLRAVEEYLTEDGKVRLNAFRTLSHLIPFCPTSLDCWNSFQFDPHTKEEQKALDSHHLTAAIRKLGEIVDTESI